MMLRPLHPLLRPLALLLLLIPAGLSAQLPRIPRIVTDGTIYAIERIGDSLYLGGSFNNAGYYSQNLAEVSESFDRPDQFTPMCNGGVECAVSDGEGGWYIGGNFTQVQGNPIRYLAHINADKTLDLNFNPDPNSTVYALFRQRDSLIVGGSFTQLGAQAVSRLGMINLANGQLLNWFPNPDGTVYDISVRPGSSVYVGGSFSRIGGRNRRNLAEVGLFADSVITGLSTNSAVYSTATDGDDIYAGGSFTEAGYYAPYVAFLGQSDDVPASRFPLFNGSISSVISDGAGGWFVGGNFSTVDGQSISRLAHILPDYTVDASFAPNPNSSVETLLLVGSDLYMGGSFTQIGGQAQAYAARFDRSSLALEPWNPNVNGTIYAIYTAGGNAPVYLGGTFSTVGGKRQQRFALVDAASGALSQTYSVNSSVYALAGDGGNRLYVGGAFTESGFHSPYAALMSSQSEIPSLDFPTFNGSVNVAISDGSNGWYLGGNFSAVDGQNIPRLCHILPNGSLDLAFNPAPNSAVHALLLSGGVLYVGGSFTSIAGQGMNRVTALDVQSGQVLSAWLGSNAGANSTVEALALNGSTLYVGGSFTQLQGQNRNRLGALDAGSGTLQAFDPGPNSTVSALMFHNSSLYVGGSFTQIAGQTRNYLAAFDASGNLLSGFAPSFNSTVVTMDENGSTIYVGGSFTTVNGQPRGYMAEINAVNGAPTAFNPAANSSVTGIRDGYVVGNFTQIGGQNRRYAARFSSNTLDAWNPQLSSFCQAVALNGNNVLLGGGFIYTAYQQQNYLDAFLIAENRFDESWTLAANSTVYALELRDNTYMYVGGSFTQVGGQPRNYLAEVNISGAGIATAWNPNLNTTVYDVLARQDSVFAAGTFTAVGNVPRRYAAAMINANHSVNTLLPWNPQMSSTVNSISMTGSSMVLGGGFQYGKYEQRSYLMAADHNAKQVLPWAPNPNSTVYALHRDSNRIYVGGNFSQIAGQPRRYISRFRTGLGAADTLDLPWNIVFPNNVSVVIYDIQTTANGVYAAGSFETTVNGQARKNAAAFSKTDGATLPWNPQVNSTVNAIAVRNDKLLLGGSFTFLKHEQRSNLLAIDEQSGLIFPSWAPQPNSTVRVLSKRGDRLYVGGSFNAFGSQSRSGLARVNLTTGAPDNWNPNVNSTVQAMAWKDNVLYIGGTFTSAKGLARNYLAAFTDDSDIPTGWNPNASSTVNALAVNDTAIYVGGDFSNIGGTSRSRLAALRPDGSLSPWNPALNGGVQAIELAGDRIYLGGGFTQVQGNTQRYLAAVKASNGELLDWNPDVNSTVQSIQARDSVVFVGGSFTQSGGQSVGYGALITPGLGITFGQLLASSSIEVLLDADSLLYAGGSFASTDGNPRLRYNSVYDLGKLTVSIETEASEMLAGLKIYPNPARDALRVEGEAAAGEAIQFIWMDLSGRELFRESAAALPANLHVPQLPAGLYLLRMSAGAQQQTSRVQILR